MRSIGRMNIMPVATDTGSSNSGTSATGPAIKAITPTNNNANGMSASTNSVVDVMNARTDSNMRTCAANVPIERGRASMRIFSARVKKKSDKSISMALQARSTMVARTCFNTSSRITAIKTPTVSTQSVSKPLLGITRS